MRAVLRASASPCGLGSVTFFSGLRWTGVGQAGLTPPLLLFRISHPGKLRTRAAQILIIPENARTEPGLQSLRSQKSGAFPPAQWPLGLSLRTALRVWMLHDSRSLGSIYETPRPGRDCSHTQPGHTCSDPASAYEICSCLNSRRPVSLTLTHTL